MIDSKSLLAAFGLALVGSLGVVAHPIAAAEAAATAPASGAANVPVVTLPAGGAADKAPAAGETRLPLDGRDGRELALDQFRPRSLLAVEQHLLSGARMPVVDVHVHPRIRLHDDATQLDELVALMDRQNIAVCVSLDGQLGAKWPNTCSICGPSINRAS